MAGIISYGTYLPLWRLSRSAMTSGGKGEKIVASFDEDSVTMGVAAGVECLKGFDRQSVDGLFFASTTSPYKEKLAATVVATALDLRRDVLVADVTNSVRAGTIALRAALDAVEAGTAEQVLVLAADCRLGAPGSEWERKCADGGAALLVGKSEIVAKAGHSFSLSDEILDVWRSEEDRFIRAWETRFVVTEGYLRVTREAVNGLMTRYGLAAEEFSKIAIAVPDKRRQAQLAKMLGFDPSRQLQDSLLDSLGDCGTAYPFVLLSSALEQAAAGDTILLAAYGNGSDAHTFEVTDRIEHLSDRRSVEDYLRSKSMIPSYAAYLHWKRLLPEQKPPYPLGEIAAPALWREREQNIRLYGGRCTACGAVQHPPQRVCVKCRAKDQFEYVRLSDKKGELVTYSIDYMEGDSGMPEVVCVVNFEGGGRIDCSMTDWTSLDDVKIGMPLEMTFRKLYVRDGIHQYLWKSAPPRI
ncbi:MAG: zinc ribbon domain-containing protein [Deltaproteobacteria bacterium]